MKVLVNQEVNERAIALQQKAQCGNCYISTSEYDFIIINDNEVFTDKNCELVTLMYNNLRNWFDCSVDLQKRIVCEKVVVICKNNDRITFEIEKEEN